MPDNLYLLKLPPYSPELNPVENLWDELREKSFGNLVFDSMTSLETHLEAALKNVEPDIDRIKSTVSWPWIINLLLIDNWNHRLNWCHEPAIFPSVNTLLLS
jgi:DDE superfamily endonuclease